ncbi:hypothetical protein OG601_47165 [Streptomyces sp. NBC_01239]|uniref:DUF7701 domain-containing protein n=1 Tax=Streptomyces sp. NBC_01239 TaxID=2903792 RepID=UPI0022586C4C|nr:hypothetical protein [Streptomyces sp. NBC_01239]MCX4809026.1 hypothetical protein [Streptomyces sp. NBC_01239]MCX4818156.1 hypothetical protein [Streptomyces sp. NBC_01239]
MTYIDTARTALESRLPGQDDALLDLYALLVLVKGEEVTLQDVHDAWAVWRSRTAPNHKSIMPFDQLTLSVQKLDQTYADAIAATRAALAEPKED